MASPSPGAAFDLMVACCRYSFDPEAERDVRALGARTDWAGLVDLARRHRVEGLVWHALDALGIEMPARERDALAGAARRIAAESLRNARASAALGEEFEKARIGMLFVKGAALGAIAYPTRFIKAAVDVDLVVEEVAVERAAAVLGQLGYTRLLPARGDLAAWHRLAKESVWRNEREQIQIDLHSRLADNRAIIPSLGATSAARLVEVAPGIALPTLADKENFAYLCVHGSSSAWFRLKWLADLAAFLQGRDEREIERLYRRSQDLGAGRAPAQALLLAERLFGTALGERLSSELRRDRDNRLLEALALGQLHARDEPTERRLGTAILHLSQLWLRPGFRFKLGETTRQAAMARANRRFGG